MNDPSEKPPELLDYRSRQGKQQSGGWLVAAIVFACLLGVYVTGTIGMMLTDGLRGFGVLAILVVVVVIAIAVASHKLGISAALAITVASVCAAVLVFGICAGGVMHNL